MVKVKYVCSSCGYEAYKWYGRCPECGQWNTFEEIAIQSSRGGRREKTIHEGTLTKLKDIKFSSDIRLSTGFEEFDRVLGGGIVLGSVILLSGDPGIGKSTLLLQLALNVSARAGKTVWYISGEESEGQVAMRARRIANAKTLEVSNLFILSSTNIDQITDAIKEKRPSLVIVDSIQTMDSTQFPGLPGSLPQVRYATSSLVECAKTYHIPVYVVGHVTKEGIVAGPMLLSHMVDALLYLEGEKFSDTRILRAFKNRFGDTAEAGIFVMEEQGLVEIKDASSFFLEKRGTSIPGSCVAVIMEGSRPLLVEIQSLVVPSTLSFPRRVISGLPERRCELLIAVIQKHVKIPLEKMDVFLNVVGGLKVLETAADLAVCLAVVSSYTNKAINATVAISEVGLLGELRGVGYLEKRISEARKFGFSAITTFSNFPFLHDAIKTLLWKKS